jgi:hypothetical protein
LKRKSFSFFPLKKEKIGMIAVPIIIGIAPPFDYTQDIIYLKV